MHMHIHIHIHILYTYTYTHIHRINIPLEHWCFLVGKVTEKMHHQLGCMEILGHNMTQMWANMPASLATSETRRSWSSTSTTPGAGGLWWEWSKQHQTTLKLRVYQIIRVWASPIYLADCGWEKDRLFLVAIKTMEITLTLDENWNQGRKATNGYGSKKEASNGHAKGMGHFYLH